MTSSKISETDPEKIATTPEIAASMLRDAEEFNKRGLFIGGCPKSGTTLLMSLLDSHPQLVVLPEETHYLEERKRYLALKGIESKLRYLLNNSELRVLGTGGIEKDKGAASEDIRSYANFNYKRFIALAEEFTSQPGMNDSLMFSEVVRAYGIALGADWRHCVRWVEKSPNNEICPEALDELFPTARVIQLVRDPRAVFGSRKSRQVKSRGHYSKAHRIVREWNRSAREIPRLRRDPSRFLVIRYEDLVKNPRENIETVCRFAGIDFNEGMLEPTRAGTEWGGNSAFHKQLNGISTAAIDQWRTSLTDQEIWWIEFHCRKGMELAKYPFQTDARFSLMRWLKPLPGESASGYIRARRASLCQGLGLLKDCRYDQ